MVNHNEESTWRIATSGLVALLLAFLFAFVGVAWVVIPHDAPIEPLLMPLLIVLAVALLTVLGMIVHRSVKSGDTLRGHSWTLAQASDCRSARRSRAQLPPSGSSTRTRLRASPRF